MGRPRVSSSESEPLNPEEWEGKEISTGKYELNYNLTQPEVEKWMWWEINLLSSQ